MEDRNDASSSRLLVSLGTMILKKKTPVILVTLLLVTIATVRFITRIDENAVQGCPNLPADGNQGGHAKERSLYGAKGLSHPDISPEWIKENDLRKQRVEEVCRKYNLTAGSLPYSRQRLNKEDVRLYVGERHGLLFCEVPKVACTNWKKVLLRLEAKFNLSIAQTEYVHSGQKNGKYMIRLENEEYPEFGIQFRLKNYLKFMILRDPLERILSAYKVLVRPGHPFFTQGRENIPKSMTKAPPFPEFIQLIVDANKSRKRLDRHWRSSLKLCNPCEIKYDVIGKYETIDEDSNNILKMINFDNVLKFPASRKGVVGDTRAKMKEYYGQLTKKQLMDIWSVYNLENEMFDLKFPDYIQTIDS